MHAPRALALGLLTSSPFTPPLRPQEPIGHDAVSTIIRSFRTVIAGSLDEAPGTRLPRLGHYPY